MDALFNMFKIKFALLDDIISSNNDIETKDEINIYINFESIMKLFVNIKMEEYLRVSKNERYLEFVSNIINLASHYRLYFAKNKLYTRIFIYMPNLESTSYINKTFNDNYRGLPIHKHSNDLKFISCREVIIEGTKIAKKICEYIEGVNIIDSKNIEPSLIPEIISKEYKKNTKHFIVSSDPYDYQYSLKGFYILRPKRDESYLVRNNIIDTIIKENNIKNKISVNELFYPFILSIIGDKYRCIPKIKNLGVIKVLQAIEKGIESSKISNNFNNIRLLLDIIKKEDDKKTILANFYTIDLDFQYKSLMSKDKQYILSQIIDRFDIDSLKKLNDLYLINNPIQLMEITSGTQYKR